MRFAMRFCTPVHIGTALISEGVRLTLSSVMRFTMRFDMRFDMRFCTTVHIGTALIAEGVRLTLSSETIGAIDPGSANPSAILDSAT